METPRLIVVKIGSSTLVDADGRLDHGYIDRVFGCGCRALGVSRESLLRFMNRRVVKRVNPANRNLKVGRPPKIATAI